jgi:hypothetical protein
VIIEFLVESELICDAQTVLEARDNQMKMTPLHIAALNPDPMAVRLELIQIIIIIYCKLRHLFTLYACGNL